MKIKCISWFVAAACIIITGWVALQWRHVPIEAPDASGKSVRNPSRIGSARQNGGGIVLAEGNECAAAHKKAEVVAKEDVPEDLTEEERREQDEEKMVYAFDSLTDRWMAPAKDGVTMKDVDEFVAQFRKVPKARKDECLHRALNLVPDENVMLLAGILMDKSQEKGLIETVYNDVLNRDEDVKQPILQQIFKDREHPCWADTAWILDVTGELPAKK